MSYLRILLFWGFAIIFCCCQSGTAQESAQAIGSASDLGRLQRSKIEQLAMLQKDFRKPASEPGVDVQLRESSRSQVEGHTVVDYDLFAKGIPRNDTYTLFQVQLDGSLVENLQGITFDERGTAICEGRKGTCQGNGPDDPIGINMSGAKGEPKRFVLIPSSDKNKKFLIYVVPFPNFETDGKCRLESILGSSNGELIFIEASGFVPNEELTVDSKSYGEAKHYKAHADLNGSYFAALLPFVSGKASGSTQFAVATHTCNPTLTFDWGRGADHLQ
jgi:hypothetical protein